MKCARKISIGSIKNKAQPAVCTSLPFWYFGRLQWWLCVHYMSIGARKCYVQPAVCHLLLFWCYEVVKFILLQPSYQCRQLPVLLINDLMVRRVDANVTSECLDVVNMSLKIAACASHELFDWVIMPRHCAHGYLHGKFLASVSREMQIKALQMQNAEKDAMLWGFRTIECQVWYMQFSQPANLCDRTTIPISENVRLVRLSWMSGMNLILKDWSVQSGFKRWVWSCHLCM